MTRLAHRHEAISTLRTATQSEPLRVLVSACIAGHACGVDGTDYGMGGVLAHWFEHPLIRMLGFCPEDDALGTPRSMPDIHGGDGFDVLDAKASVLSPEGSDLTTAMLRGARAMVAFAKRERAELAVLTDMSAACGSQVISDGCRLVEDRKYRAGVGVATALLLREGLAVVSQRDDRTLALILARIEGRTPRLDGLLDHHQREWYRRYFGA